MEDLPEGLYERIIDLATRRKIERHKASIEAESGDLDPGESHIQIARHLERVLQAALKEAGTSAGRLEAQAAIANDVIRIAGPNALPECRVPGCCPI